MKLCKQWHLNWCAPAYCASDDWGKQDEWNIFITCDDFQTEWYVVARYMNGALGIDHIVDISTHETLSDAMKSATIDGMSVESLDMLIDEGAYSEKDIAHHYRNSQWRDQP